jgi:ribosomal protein S18 acetylase RimI-like enzyme
VPVRLRELTDDELPEFLAVAHRFYVNDLVTHAAMTEERAQEKSRRDHASLVPGGKRQPGHHLCWIEDEASGEQIGRMWYRVRDDGVVFLYQIDLEPSARGRGLGRESMRLLEEKARALGARTVELNVFGGNDVARGLYRSLGYAEQAVYMGKEI